MQREYDPFDPHFNGERHYAKVSALWAQLDPINYKIKALEKQPTQVTLTKVEKVPLSDVAPPKKRKVHKFRQVPKIERKKARRKSLIIQARKQPTLVKRLKFLRSRGIRPTTKEREKLK
ncbi:MAG: hypothetical protein QGI60_00990 [archaeon]|nr:hypothetical protein [archaeon]